ncbi:MAG: VanW family protein [Microlunatus sp.]
MTSQSPPPNGPFDHAQPGGAQPPHGSDDGPLDPDATLIRGPLPPDPAQQSDPENSPAADETLDFAVAAAAADSGAAAVAVPPAEGKKTSRAVAVAAGAVVVLLGAVYLIGYLMAGDKLPRDAQIAGIAVGGLTTEQAAQQLQDQLGERATAPITVAAGDRKAVIKPADAGLSVDYPASISAAGGGRSLNPGHIWQVLTGGSDTDPVVVTDQQKLTAAVTALVGELDRKPTNAKLALDGAKVEQTKGRDGVTVDQEKAAGVIEAAYLGSATEAVKLPATITEPDITTAEVAQVVSSYVKPAVSDPVTVKAGAAGSFTLTPAMIGNSIDVVAADGTVKAQLDPEKLRSAAAPVLSKVELKKPRDATVRLVKGKPKVIPAVNGTTVKTADLAAAVEPVLTKTGKERRTQVELTGAKAAFSTADAEKLGIKRVTGEFTTYFPYAYYRNVNISRAAERINNTVLKPGETFSLNGIVGERTAANGFVEGYIIQGGKFKKELGGGVSQSATTTFNAMFFAGLKDIQHQPHTLYIDRYPPGREATVAWPTLDLKFQNNTKYGVLVQAYVKKSTPGSKGSITVKMWSTKTYDKITSSKLARSNFTTGRDITDDSPKCEAQAPVQGFDVNYSRIFSNDGKVVKTEKFFWRYAPTDRITCKR